MKNRIKSLKFQILTPIFIFFILVLSVSLTVVYNLQVKLAKMEAQSSLNLKLNNAIIEFNHIRSLSKERMLLYVLTSDQEFLKSFEALEEKRNEKEKALFDFFLIHPHFSTDSIIFKQTYLQTKNIRAQIVEKVKSKNKQIALQYFGIYSSLFNINSARLVDINNRLETELALSQKETTAFYKGLIFFVIFMLSFGFLLIILFLRFYQKNIILPLKSLSRGLREINKGNFPHLALKSNSPLEIHQMIFDFNASSKSLKEVKDELLKANRIALNSAKVQSEFLSNMSHEIRTPLNSIIGMGELLAEKKLPNENGEFVSIIVNSGQLLLNLVNDILDFSKLESGTIDLNETVQNLEHLIQRIQSVLNFSVQKKSLKFNVHISDSLPEYILCDSLRVEQILLNLVSNAVKFTDKGIVELSAERDVINKKEYLKLKVSDTGIGIPEEQLNNLFNRFTQADSSITKKYGGTGLGLAIVKQIVELMEGWIISESEIGKGSCFTVHIPLKKAIGKENKDNKTNESFAEAFKLRESTKILLVDDSKENRLLIQAYLNEYPISMDEAENGQLAFAAFKNNKYDLVLMDMQMPVMDGCTATAKIRAYEKANNLTPVPILALSAYALTEEREKSENAGCNLHLTKPIKKDVLISSLLNFLGLQP